MQRSHTDIAVLWRCCRWFHCWSNNAGETETTHFVVGSHRIPSLVLARKRWYYSILIPCLVMARERSRKSLGPESQKIHKVSDFLLLCFRFSLIASYVNTSTDGHTLTLKINNLCNWETASFYPFCSRHVHRAVFSLYFKGKTPNWFRPSPKM